jgi:Kelch motif/Galactose oxidase, central domain
MRREHLWFRDSCLFVPLVAFTLLVCSGCSGDGGGASHRPPPTITSFAAAKNPVTAGTSTTLTGVFTGGTGVVSNGVGTVSSGVPVSTGNLTGNTTFILTVTDSAGTAVSRSFTVSVVPAPRIASFSATPATVAPDGMTTLNAVFENGVGSIDQSIGTITSGAGITTIKVTVTRFSTTGAMGTSREGHTATLLPNGKVLIVGGSDGTQPLNSAELYDTTTGTFAPTAASGMQRIVSATLLQNGRVLVIGQVADSLGTLQPAAELYDASAGNFSSTGAPLTARPAHTATLLQSGKVLVVSGHDSCLKPSAAAEIYDPVAGAFSYTGSPAAVFDGHTATLLPGGKVLVAGGDPDCTQPFTAIAELYDPISGVFVNAGVMLQRRAFHTATLLPSGKVLLAGNCYLGCALITAELFDPSSGTFTATGQMNTDGVGQTATPLYDGTVFIAGGASRSSGFREASNPEIYDPPTGKFSATYPLLVARRGHSATLLQNGKVLVAGGRNFDDVLLSSAELYE